ncbi:hypothetical protein [Methanocaldococcus sp. FS406-22]|uniref:hypothetical protein n=1 Tax=Methanocaldococcus sp. (strain FS406-22) TaxID=644281 RepID=UPI0012EA6117|nr:hypothetical protein [Methanocaldococcus sp. FS406-22]
MKGDIKDCIPSSCIGYIYVTENTLANKFYVYDEVDFVKFCLDILACYPIKKSEVKEFVEAWDRSGNYLTIYKLRESYSQKEYLKKLLEFSKENLKNYWTKGAYPTPHSYERYNDIIIYKLDYEDVDGNKQTEYSCVVGNYLIISNSTKLLKDCIDTLTLFGKKSLLDVRKKEYEELKSYINVNNYDVECAEFYPPKTYSSNYDCAYGVIIFNDNKAIIKFVAKYPDEYTAEQDFDNYYLKLMDKVRYEWNGKINAHQDGIFIFEETEIPIDKFNDYINYEP